MIIETIKGNIRDIDETDSRLREHVYLDREQLARPHQKLRSEEGTIYGLSLPHGEHLHAGDILYADADRLVVVALQAEDALLIRPANREQWARAAWNIGNMHHGAYLREDPEDPSAQVLVTAYDDVLAQLLRKLAVPCVRQQLALEGLRLAAGQGGHHHHHGLHDHGHGEENRHD